MSDVSIVFFLHHAERLRRAGDFAEGGYVDEPATSESLREAASRWMLPALKLLREVIEQSEGAVRLGLCPSGPLLRSAEKHHGALLRSLQKLGATGAVEWICSPRDYSILSIFPGDHVARELAAQANAIERLFGARPTTAANTELIYDNPVARRAAAVGMKLVLCGFADPQLGGRTANRVYRAAGDAGAKVMSRHLGLSDDWGIRFGDPDWPCHPLKPETYVDWITGSLQTSGGSVCPIMLHLSDLGRTHPKESGIMSFSRRVLRLLPKHGLNLVTPQQAGERAGQLAQLDVLDIPQATSGWGPVFDLVPWLGNAMQSNALHLLRQALEDEEAMSAADREALIPLCSADHLQAMRYPPQAAGGNGGEWGRMAEERRRPLSCEGPFECYERYTAALRHFVRRRPRSRRGEATDAARSRFP